MVKTGKAMLSIVGKLLMCFPLVMVCYEGFIHFSSAMIIIMFVVSVIIVSVIAVAFGADALGKWLSKGA